MPLSNEELKRATAARGFMPEDEGIALANAVSEADLSLGPLLEVGSYCGRSACFIGPVAKRRLSKLFCVDHHRGSEENQPGWEWHEPDLVDPQSGLIDTLKVFRDTIADAELEDTVIAVVGESTTVAQFWNTPLSFLLIDGGHSEQSCQADFDSWVDKLAVGGTLCIHDVFFDPSDGGSAPRLRIYEPALRSGRFEDIAEAGSLRVLRRTS